ncbi:MAG: Ig-like domain-containing protein, partial [Actinomycetota bacterium]|nr:Ig-like domain-containing protein [Actinomycetota bacterium]
TVATTTTTRPAVGAPTVVIQSPQAGVVSGMVSIRASATDDGTVKTIEVYVDGKRLVRKQGGSAVRSWNSNSASVKPGPHTITVKAYDEQGNVGTSSVVVTK